jgi:Domain of unknown function (DUF4258)
MDIGQLHQAIGTGNIRITDHADEEMHADHLVLDDVLVSGLAGEIIEEYPTDHPLPSCLVYGQSARGEHIHSVWAYNQVSGKAVLVTIYRPDSDRWIDWRKRKRP